MLTLGIETAWWQGGVALLDGPRPVAVRPLEVAQRHGQTLLVEIQALFREAGLPFDACELIAVSRGPGSFTGLRVGLTCAKMLAFALERPVVGVDTFQGLAARVQPPEGRLQIVMDAQRQEFFCQTFEACPERGWRPLTDLKIMLQADFVKSLAEEERVSGPGLDVLSPDLRSNLRCVDCTLWQPAPEGIARLAQRLYVERGADDRRRLCPLYGRRSAAEEKRSRAPEAGPAS